MYLTPFIRGTAAGFGGNAAGQLIVNGSTDNFSFSQASIAGAVGATSLAVGNIGGFTYAFPAFQSNKPS